MRLNGFGFSGLGETAPLNTTAGSVVQAPVLGVMTIIGDPAQNGKVYSATPSVTNSSETGSLVWSISYSGGEPTWATFSDLTGVLSGTPPDGVEIDSGTVTLRATNSAGFDETTYELAAYSILISGTPDPLATSLDGGTNWSFTPSVASNDPDGFVSFTHVGKPSWISINSGTGQVSQNTNDLIRGKYEFDLIADAGTGRSNTKHITIEVPDWWRFSTQYTWPASVALNREIDTSIPPNYPDPTFVVVSKPAWATVASNGTITGTPTAGVHTFVVDLYDFGSTTGNQCEVSVTFV